MIDSINKILSGLKISLSASIIFMFSIILHITLASDNTFVLIMSEIISNIFKAQNNLLFLYSLISNTFIIFLSIILFYTSLHVANCVNDDKDYSFANLKIDFIQYNELNFLKNIVTTTFSLKYLISVIFCYWSNKDFLNVFFSGVSNIAIVVLVICAGFSFVFIIAIFINKR